MERNFIVKRCVMRQTGRYFVYITTNQHRTTLYIGVTDDLQRRLQEHLEDALYHRKHFTGQYQSFHLIYYEVFGEINEAIVREKQLKGWTRKKKLALIKTVNPELRLLNDELPA